MPSGTLMGLCGSLRSGSFNRKLMMEASRAFDPGVFIDGNLRLPLYDGDLEEAEGIPTEVQALADQIASADAVIVVGPEYNKAISGVLKNALDWISRTKGSPWNGKPVAILSATAGRSGGERTQLSMRECMVAFRPRLILGPEVLIGGASKEFDGDTLTGEMGRKLLGEQMTALRMAAGL
ncbi:NAD(P)H-dependent oxidoreductase [Gymnodinialimonas sp. 2305UL16-5]|uniref:NADPH-dependent FMN reductase n=1 Tax=Gymnodinialimonas mytili TaxID=3126503 RepID=UPI00309D4CB7